MTRSRSQTSDRRPLHILLATLAAMVSSPAVYSQDYEGDWCGRSAQDMEVSFNVVGDTVSEASFGASVSSGGGCFSSATASGVFLAPIVDNSFTIDDPLVLGISLTLTGTFASTEDASGTVTMMDSFCGVTVSVPWRAFRGDCRPVIGAESLRRNFGEVPVGTAVPPRKITLVNEGTANLSISSIRLAGVHRDEFSLPADEDRCSSVILTPAASCRFRVGFEPAATGLRKALAVVSSNDPDGGEVSIQLRGTGIRPATLQADPLRRNFGEVTVGAAAALRQVTLTNHGRRKVRLARIVIRGANRDEFTLPEDEDRCSAVRLSPGKSCRFRVGFEPTAEGLRRALAVIRSNDPDAGEVRVLLRGTGVAAGPVPARDLVLVNGDVLTLDAYDTVASAVRVRDGRIVAVGDDVGPLDGPGVEVIDLGGRTVIPGLVASGDDTLAADPGSWKLAFAQGTTSFAARSDEGQWVLLRRRFSGAPGGLSAAVPAPASPWLAIEAAVATETDRLDALRRFTSVRDSDPGSIEVGRRADLVVLSRPYLAIPEEEIGALSSVLTLVDGVVVFDELDDR